MTKEEWNALVSRINEEFRQMPTPSPDEIMQAMRDASQTERDLIEALDKLASAKQQPSIN